MRRAYMQYYIWCEWYIAYRVEFKQETRKFLTTKHCTLLDLKSCVVGKQIKNMTFLEKKNQG